MGQAPKPTWMCMRAVSATRTNMERSAKRARLSPTKGSMAIRLVLGDQLTRQGPALRDAQPQDVVLLAEVRGEAGYVPHHRKKIAFFFAAMRHFAENLRGEGLHVEYVKLDDTGNTGTIAGEVKRAVERFGATKLIATEAGEWRLKQEMEGWQKGSIGIEDVEIREDDRFLASRKEFENWAKDKKQLRMEFFYREMRQKYNILMTKHGDPKGGKWNFDADNRKALPAGVVPPKRLSFAPDEITKEVIELVRHHFPKNFGELEGFQYAVTEEDAQKALQHFIKDCLPKFGDYQDAMKQGQPLLYHSLISMYINAGMLDPLKVCRAAEEAYEDKKAPLNAVEGFIRQILGWREYVRGIYWKYMPEYKQLNYLEANRPLPAFYWDESKTDCNCLKQTVKETRENAYAHHIQRLMVTGNFALIAGVHPDAINEWYLAVYADAIEWVELPNVHGMAIFADGGIMASKPYAASGAYINRMSDYCSGCKYDVKAKNGPKACPLNYLYWDFYDRNRDKLKKNPRIGMALRTFDKFDEKKKELIRHDSKKFLDTLEAW